MRQKSECLALVYFHLVRAQVRCGGCISWDARVRDEGGTARLEMACCDDGGYIEMVEGVLRQ